MTVHDSRWGGRRLTRNSRKTFHFCSWLFVLLAVGCSSDEPRPEDAHDSTSTQSVATMILTSNAFEHGTKLDAKYTADGDNISPHLAWSSTPDGTQSFALICDDPDAPSPRRPAANPWVHWVIYNIPGDRTELPAAIGRELEPHQVSGARQGVNSWSSDNVGYRGPEPPRGSGTHRYVFKLFALDAVLQLEAGGTKQQLLEAIEGHVLGEGELVGKHER